ncbi:MAG TPA: hypothetical protein VK614_03270 [Allosphingosinicella sp.]|nr:hypothetical protein [Allosphingosinicella sp.]
MARTEILGAWLRHNWFLPLLAILLAIELAFTRSIDWSQPRMPEAAVLFDLCLFIPALHFLCYRRKRALKPLLIRTAALALLGVYIASKLIPPEAQGLLAKLSWARTAGLAVVALIELRLLFLALKLVFGGHASAEEIAERTGAPPWIARLMLLEARFWKWVWRRIRGR